MGVGKKGEELGQISKRASENNIADIDRPNVRVSVMQSWKDKTPGQTRAGQRGSKGVVMDVCRTGERLGLMSMNDSDSKGTDNG